MALGSGRSTVDSALGTRNERQRINGPQTAPTGIDPVRIASVPSIGWQYRDVATRRSRSSRPGRAHPMPSPTPTTTVRRPWPTRSDPRGKHRHIPPRRALCGPTRSIEPTEKTSLDPPRTPKQWRAAAGGGVAILQPQSNGDRPIPATGAAWLSATFHVKHHRRQSICARPLRRQRAMPTPCFT